METEIGAAAAGKDPIKQIAIRNKAGVQEARNIGSDALYIDVRYNAKGKIITDPSDSDNIKQTFTTKNLASILAKGKLDGGVDAKDLEAYVTKEELAGKHYVSDSALASKNYATIEAVSNVQRNVTEVKGNLATTKKAVDSLTPRITKLEDTTSTIADNTNNISLLNSKQEEMMQQIEKASQQIKNLQKENSELKFKLDNTYKVYKGYDELGFDAAPASLVTVFDKMVTPSSLICNIADGDTNTYPTGNGLLNITKTSVNTGIATFTDSDGKVSTSVFSESDS